VFCKLPSKESHRFPLPIHQCGCTCYFPKLCCSRFQQGFLFLFLCQAGWLKSTPIKDIEIDIPENAGNFIELPDIVVEYK